MRSYCGKPSVCKVAEKWILLRTSAEPFLENACPCFLRGDSEVYRRKENFLRRNKIAVYDSIKECTICGSSDSSIRSVVPSDIKSIIENSKVKKILANGKTAAKYFLKYQDENLCSMLKTLPSTSPANASFSLEKLAEIWRAEFEK